MVIYMPYTDLMESIFGPDVGNVPQEQVNSLLEGLCPMQRDVIRKFYEGNETFENISRDYRDMGPRDIEETYNKAVEILSFPLRLRG